MRADQVARDFARDLSALTRALSERQKKALTLGIAIAPLVNRGALRNQGVHERLICDAHGAILGSIFGYRDPAGRRPIGRSVIRLRHGFAELRYLAARRFVKLFAFIRAPPVAHITVLVEFRSEGIETMGHLAGG